MTRPCQPTQAAARSTAFSLVEVMISVALVLFLIIGVNQVFKMTTDTVGAGQIMSGNVRDTRAAQAVLFNDLGAAVMQTPPAFIISSSRVSAFRNKNDRDTAKLFAGTGAEPEIRKIDLDNNGTEGETTVFGEVISPATYNYRSHRIDRLAFFARDIYQRQTGDDGTFASTTRSNEAYIWYGALRLFNNAGAPRNPGELVADNQNNLDASQFALGRMAVVMRDPNDASFPAERYFPRVPAVPAPASGTPTPYNQFMTPFGYNSQSNVGAFGIQQSRFDLAGTTIAQFLQDTTDWSLGSTRNGPFPAQAEWWQRLLYTGPYAALTAPRPATDDYRFEADRYFAKPLDAQKASRIAPILLSGCSQFIVEYAGDFIEQNDVTGVLQDKNGDGVTAEPDGVTDFVVDSATGSPVRSIRWYGMPRDVAGGTKGGPDGSVQPGTAAAPSVDVVPLRDVRGTPAPFERYVDKTLLPISSTDNYLDVTGGTPKMAPDARYDCVWGPDVYLNPDPLVVARNPLPQMLRITFVLDDPTGRLAEGQVYEYVITLPR